MLLFINDIFKQTNVGRLIVVSHMQRTKADFAVINFGVDDYPKLNKHSGYVNTKFVDAEVLKWFLQNNSPIDVNKYAPKSEIIYQ